MTIEHDDARDDEMVAVRRGDLAWLLDVPFAFAPQGDPQKRLRAAGEGPALPREEPAGWSVKRRTQADVGPFSERESAEAFAASFGGDVYALSYIARPVEDE